MKIILVTSLSFVMTKKGWQAVPYIPLGLLQIASVAEHQGHIVKIVDLSHLVKTDCVRYNKDYARNFAGWIFEEYPDVVGFSTMCNSFPQTLRIAQAVRARSGSIPIILGGPQATSVDQHAIQEFPSITAIVRGEAEISFPKALDWLSGYRSVEDVPGITYLNRVQVARNEDGPLLLNLDALPLPAYHLFSTEEFSEIPIEAGRGCPFRCSFCSTSVHFRHRYRMKSPSRLIEEIKFCMKQTKSCSFQFVHDNFTVDSRRVAALCSAIRSEDLRLSWRCSSRIDNADNRLLSEMRAAGCSAIFFGIETGSGRIQHIIQKGLDVTCVQPTLETVIEKGITPSVSFIVGFPEEKMQDLIATLGLALRLFRIGVVDVQFHLLAPLAGSQLQTQYRSELVLSNLNRISDFGGNLLHRQDYNMVQGYPQLFSCFYSFPTHLNRVVLWLVIIGAFLLSSMFSLVRRTRRPTLQYRDRLGASA